MPEPRTYRAQRWLYWVGALFAGAYLFVAVLVDTPLLWLLMTLGASAAGCVFWWLLPRRTASESAAGLAVAPYRPWRPWETTPWSSIEEFYNVGNTLYLRQTDGRRSWVPGVSVNGMVTRWDGGQTRDVVGELNQRLQLWKDATSPQDDRGSTQR